MFFSDARQDEFVANILNFKRDGYFVDIGSCSAIGSNNTFFFEGLNWNGLCVELNSSYNESYNFRKCNYMNGNALTLDYASIFKNLNFPQSIDYLSMDIDELSFEALIKIPHDKYKFKVITIEHDAYRLGDSYRTQQRDFLFSLGYELAIGNVFIEQNGYEPNSPFEDWWVNSVDFAKEPLDKIRSYNEYPSNIIKKFHI